MKVGEFVIRRTMTDISSVIWQATYTRMVYNIPDNGIITIQVVLGKKDYCLVSSSGLVSGYVPAAMDISINDEEWIMKAYEILA